MSKDHNIDDAELANISGAGKEQELAAHDDPDAIDPTQNPIGGGGGGGGSPDGAEPQDQDGGTQDFGG